MARGGELVEEREEPGHGRLVGGVGAHHRHR
jgi:hypothetical protein